MAIIAADKNKIVTTLLNGTISAFQSVVPLSFTISKPQLAGSALQLHFGVLIGITDEIKGNIILSGEPEVFSAIGKSMFGMDLEGEMLTSFSGELGNMIAGAISTEIGKEDISINITPPTILSGNTSLTGFEKAIQITFGCENTGNVDVYLLLNS